MPHPTPSGETGRGDIVCGRERGWLKGERDQQLGDWNEGRQARRRHVPVGGGVGEEKASKTFELDEI